MLFSVIIPVYNTGNDLQRALNSVLVQEGDFDDYEVLAVDDGSTDSLTLDILANYETSINFRVIR